ncbi:hypothetical protein GF323_03530 [Candidatus Woesearchaeota archaeon]|nr:hypothetical protein [Candidatus Woesearchaeota archaeon]
MNKKAALQLSINAIVIVILAMTLLGLGLGFIKGMMNKMSDFTEGSFDKIKEQLQQDLMDSDKTIAFSQSKFTLERGKGSLEGVGITNEEAQQLDVGIKFNAIDCPAGCPNLENWFTYKKGAMMYQLPAGKTEVKKINLEVPSGTTKGLYLIEVEVYKGVHKDSCMTNANVNGCTTDSSQFCKWDGASKCVLKQCSDLTSSECSSMATCSYNTNSNNCTGELYQKYAATEVFLTVA